MKNILLIEDNESILKGLVYSLEQERFKVTTAMTIKDSKNLLESNNIYNINNIRYILARWKRI